MHTYDFSPMFRYSVGFDRMQKLLEASSARTEVSYPPYNIETDNEETYRISVAVAGFEMDELNISVEDGTLSITGIKSDEKGSKNYIHQGIAGRNFRLKFNLADYIKVNTANIDNGMLMIDLERKIPEELKPKQIKITANSTKPLSERVKNLIGSEKEAA